MEVENLLRCHVVCGLCDTFVWCRRIDVYVMVECQVQGDRGESN